MESKEILILLDSKKSKDRGSYWGNFCRTCHHFGLKFRFVTREEFQEMKKISAPVVVGDAFQRIFGEFLEEKYPGIRTIFLESVDRNLYKGVSCIECNLLKLAKDVLSYCAKAGRKNVALYAFDNFSCRTGPFSEAYLKAAKMVEGCSLSVSDIFLNDENGLSNCFARLYAGIEKYNAVICANDLSALYLITELRERGIRVPEDVFVIGYANSPVARSASPTITSIEIEEQKRAELCVSLWRFLQKNPEVQSVGLTVEHSLVVRESTGLFYPVGEGEPFAFSKQTGGDDRGYGGLHGLQTFLKRGNSIEQTIVSMILQGKSTAEICEALYLSESTVKYRIRNLLEMFSVQTKSELCAILKHYNIHF